MTLHDYKLVCPAYTLLADGKICEKCAGGRFYNAVRSKLSRSGALAAACSRVLHSPQPEEVLRRRRRCSSRRASSSPTSFVRWASGTRSKLLPNPLTTPNRMIPLGQTPERTSCSLAALSKRRAFGRCARQRCGPVSRSGSSATDRSFPNCSETSTATRTSSSSAASSPTRRGRSCAERSPRWYRRSGTRTSRWSSSSRCHKGRP